MKIIKINSALKDLKKINDEIRYADCFKEEQFHQRPDRLQADQELRSENKSTMTTKTSSAKSLKAAAACG